MTSYAKKEHDLSFQVSDCSLLQLKWLGDTFVWRWAHRICYFPNSRFLMISGNSFFGPLLLFFQCCCQTNWARAVELVLFWSSFKQLLFPLKIFYFCTSRNGGTAIRTICAAFGFFFCHCYLHNHTPDRVKMTTKKGPGNTTETTIFYTILLNIRFGSSFTMSKSQHNVKKNKKYNVEKGIHNQLRLIINYHNSTRRR